MSLPRLWGSSHAGNSPGCCASPQGHQPCLSDSTAGLLPAPLSPAKPGPDLSLSPSPGRCLLPKDGTVPVSPAACTLLGWQDRSWLSCLVSTDPHGQPPHPAGPGPGRFKRVILGSFSLGRHPTAVKMFLCLLFSYLSTLYCLFFSLHSNSSQTFSAPLLVLEKLIKAVNNCAPPCFFTHCLYQKQW